MSPQKRPDEVLRLENQLCFALYAASKAVIQAYRPYLGPIGITYPQYLVFLALWEEDGIPLKTLGAKLYLDSGTLTPLLKRLEKQGYLSRQRFAGDEREIRICLTNKGKELKEKAREIPEAILCEAGIEAKSAMQLRNDARGLLQKMI